MHQSAEYHEYRCRHTFVDTASKSWCSMILSFKFMLLPSFKRLLNRITRKFLTNFLSLLVFNSLLCFKYQDKNFLLYWVLIIPWLMRFYLLMLQLDSDHHFNDFELFQEWKSVLQILDQFTALAIVF